MTSPRDATHEAFDRQSTDPQAYLELARTLTIAAAPEVARFREVLHGPRSDTRLEMLAYVNAYMLLTGLAFEYLLKAIALSRGWTIEQLTKLRGGHGLVAIADALTLELAPVERDYLRRLEEFVVWAGRYPVPRRSDTYATSERDGLLTFMSDDPTRGEHLFDRLAEHVGPSPRPTDD